MMMILHPIHGSDESRSRVPQRAVGRTGDGHKASVRASGRVIRRFVARPEMSMNLPEKHDPRRTFQDGVS